MEGHKDSGNRNVKTADNTTLNSKCLDMKMYIVEVIRGALSSL